MSTPPIAVIGGGPCGLTLARLLECQGIDYVVYERDESENSNRVGGSLDIHPETGQHALKEGGVFEEFKKYARYDDTVFKVADKDGKQLLAMGEGRDAPEIDRVSLRQILLDAIPKEKVKWGHALKSVTLGEDKKPVLKFTNGAVASGFKLIVGADGAWSKVRPLVTKAKPTYSGVAYVESKIGRKNPVYDGLAAKAGAGINLSIGSNEIIVTQRQGNGSYRHYFGIKIAEDLVGSGPLGPQDAEAIRQLLLSDYYADWSEEHKELIRQATEFRGWPLYTLDEEDISWKSVPGLTLAGDAAHLSITNGEGVNLALTDSFKLASKIAEHGMENLDQAVQEYEEGMFPSGVATITSGKRMLKAMFVGDPKKFLEMLLEAVQEEC